MCDRALSARFNGHITGALLLAMLLAKASDAA